MEKKNLIILCLSILGIGIISLVIYFIVSSKIEQPSEEKIEQSYEEKIEQPIIQDTYKTPINTLNELDCDKEETTLKHYYENVAHRDWKITDILKVNKANNYECDMIYDTHSDDNRFERQARRFTLGENKGKWFVTKLAPGGSGTTVM